MNTAAYERATNRPWDDWVHKLDNLGARDIEHPQIVPLVMKELQGIDLKNAGWWAQGITIAYEQHIGRRIPGQKPDGTFAGGVSRTFTGSMDEALNAWLDLVAEREDFLDLELDGEPSTSATDKWRYWRCTLSDGSKVNLTVNETAPGKARIAVEHSKLLAPEAVDDAKQFWKALLAEL